MPTTTRTAATTKIISRHHNNKLKKITTGLHLSYSVSWSAAKKLQIIIKDITCNFCAGTKIVCSCTSTNSVQYSIQVMFPRPLSVTHVLYLKKWS
jgi:hypothetical protein